MFTIILNNFDNFSIHNTILFSRVDHKNDTFGLFALESGLENFVERNLINETVSSCYPVQSSLNWLSSLSISNNGSHFQFTWA